MSRLDLIIEQIRTARLHTESLLDAITSDDWFREPTEGVTHVAWQVGHLAYAEHLLRDGTQAGAATRGRGIDSGTIPFSVPTRFLTRSRLLGVPEPGSHSACV